MVRVPSGRRIYVEDQGVEHTEGVPVLLVHGFASNHETWVTLEPALRAHRRTISVDLPGFGASERLEGDYSPAAIAQDLAAVLDHAGVERADIVAHSWGSSVTLAFALAFPQRVRRLVLIGAWIYDEQIPPFFRWARAPGIGEMLFTGFYRERPEDRFPMAFEDPSIVSQELVEAVERSLERPGTARAALAAARGQCFLQQESRYRTVRQPTLLVWGASDRVARLRFGERLATDLPNARLEVIPRVGHFPMLENPSRTRTLVTEFLDAAEQPPERPPVPTPSAAPASVQPTTTEGPST
jgi:pimeloyl-ACP methyl ester carboxylesterase